MVKVGEFGIEEDLPDFMLRRSHLKRMFLDPQKIESCDRKGARFKMGDVVEIKDYVTGYEFPWGRIKPRHSYDMRGHKAQIVGKEGTFYIVRTEQSNAKPGEGYGDFWAKPKAIERVCRP